MTAADEVRASEAANAPAIATPVLWAAVFIVGLALTVALRVPGFVHHDTTEVVMWGHSGWASGFWKHPPFLPWLTRVWFLITPMGALSLAVLTALNITLAAWAVWAIARMHARRPNHAVPVLAVILLTAVPYATVMAIKLNHNTMLISLWPLTILAFLRALDRPTVMRGALFGALAACAMLAKYYSGLLLASCIIAALVTPERNRFWRSPAPYVAVVACLALMSPHILWLIEQRASTLAYAFHADPDAVAASKRGPAMALMFAWQTPLLMLPMAMIAWLYVRANGNPTRAECGQPAPHRFERELLVLTVLPYLATIAMTLVFSLRGATNWAMPLYLMLPVIAAARIGAPSARALKLAAATVAASTVAICIAGQIGARIAVARGVDGSTDPRQEIAIAINVLWRQSVGSALPIVGGDNRLASAAVLYAPDHPQGWPSFSTTQAPWIDIEAARTGGFIAVCRATDAACSALAARAALGRGIGCTLRQRVEAYGATGPWLDVKVLLVPPRDQEQITRINSAQCKPE